jgi:ribonuclease HI
LRSHPKEQLFALRCASSCSILWGFPGKRIDPKNRNNGPAHAAVQASVPFFPWVRCGGAVKITGSLSILLAVALSAANLTAQADTITFDVSGSMCQVGVDRKLREYVLPDGWVVIAAGNPASERGVHFSMPRPLRNRFVHLDLEADLSDWCKWAVGAGVRPEIIAFLLFKPDLLHTADATSDANAWAAIMMSDNKSWEMSGSSPWTTISEMELTAAVEALRSIPTGSSVQLFSDSELLIRGMLFHIRRWQAIEWRNSRGAPLQHQALWEELLARNEQLNIHWQWIRDHRGHPVQTRADALAYKSAQQEVHSRLLIPEDVL